MALNLKPPKPIAVEIEGFTYRSFDDLAGMSLEDLERLWELVPPQDQQALQAALQRACQKQEALDDAGELRVAQALLEQYRSAGLVPVGDAFLKVPPAMQEAFKQDEVEEAFESELVRQAKFPRWAVLLCVPVVFFVAFGFVRGSGSQTEATLMPTVGSTATPSPTPTATPLALNASDQAIRAGQQSNRAYYPVRFQVDRPGITEPRIFVVQEQPVSLSEWSFENNPDIASWIGGLILRPVLGLPYSAANQALVESLEPGALFTLTMNTGASFQFAYEDQEQVGRQDTRIFRQTAPGMVMVLIGETNVRGLPTSNRWVVTATYLADQEVARIAASEASLALIPLGTMGVVGDDPLVSVVVLRSELTVADGLPGGIAYGVVDVQITTGLAAIRSDTLQWSVEDRSGNRFSMDASASGHGDCSPLPVEIPAETSLCASVGFLVSQVLTDARLLIALGAGQPPVAFQVTFDPPSLPSSPANLDVQLREVAYDGVSIVAVARLFNPQTQVIRVNADDAWLTLGFTPHPSGPRLPPQNFTPFELAAGAAGELGLTFPWSGEPFATLGLLGREYAITVFEEGG